jgi:hypothetical protein
VQSFEKVLTLDPNHAVAQRSLDEARKRLRERGAQKKTSGPSR